MANDFADYVARTALRLDSVDPGAPLDDLEPLAAMLGSARVVAIGENAHCVREFYQWRHRLTRFLVERLGFTAFAMESGFSEGLAVDEWVRGGPGDLQRVADEGITYNMGRCAEMRDHLRWMREVDAPVRFFGLDVPGSTSSALPALAHVEDYLAKVDDDAVPLVARLTTLVGLYAGPHSLPAYSAYAALERPVRDEMTALFAELSTRFDALEPDYAAAGPDFSVVRHELRLATLLDQAMRVSGGTVHPKVAARDRGIAETVCWLLDRLGPDARIVIGAHNSHLQRTPVHTPAFPLSAAGHHLATRLGDDYLVIAGTCTAGRTSTHRRDPGRPGGVAITAAELPPPAEGSVEAALAAVPGPHVVDLRGARGLAAAPHRIRIMADYQEAPIPQAYDLVVNIPEVSTTEQVEEFSQETLMS